MKDDVCSTVQESDGSEVEEGIMGQSSKICVDTEIYQSESSAKWRVDTDALTGLRGIVALHIALGHMFFFSRLSLDLLGGISMSFFYLLSGFIMSIAYGAKALKDEQSQANDTLDTDTTEPIVSPVIDKWDFWRKRFARLYPMYFLTNLTQVPINYITDGSFSSESFSSANIILTITGMNLWVFPFNHDFFPLNGATWTIQTMWFFYLVFPAIFPLLLQMNDRFQKIRIMYFVQLAFFHLPYFIYVPLLGYEGFMVGYWTARGWPLLRLPVFLMGCLAGIERVKRKRNDWCGQIEAPMIGRGPLSGCSCCCSSKIEGIDGEGKYWDSQYIGNRSAILYSVLIVSIILSSVLIGEEIGQICRLFGEAYTPLLFLRLLLSLTETTDEYLQRSTSAAGDENSKRSSIEYICRSKAAIFLGNISLCFYLIHSQVIECTRIIYSQYTVDTLKEVSAVMMPDDIQACTGESTWGDCLETVNDNHCGFWDDGKCSQYESEFEIIEEKAYQNDWPPIWIIPVNLVISLVLGYALTYMVEKPLQSIFRRGCPET